MVTALLEYLDLLAVFPEAYVCDRIWKKPGFHTHTIKLTFSPEMDYWLNALSYSTAGLAPKPRVWFLWQLFLDPV